MFEDMNVMKDHELKARNEVKWETYTKKIQIEARVMGDLVMNHIVPIATHYQSQLAKNVQSMINIFGREEATRVNVPTKLKMHVNVLLHITIQLLQEWKK